MGPSEEMKCLRPANASCQCSLSSTFHSLRKRWTGPILASVTSHARQILNTRPMREDADTMLVYMYIWTRRDKSCPASFRSPETRKKMVTSRSRSQAVDSTYVSYIQSKKSRKTRCSRCAVSWSIWRMTGFCP